MMNILYPGLIDDYVTFKSGNIIYNKKINGIDENDIKYNNEEILKDKYLRNDIELAQNDENFNKYFNR